MRYPGSGLLHSSVGGAHQVKRFGTPEPGGLPMRRDPPLEVLVPMAEQNKLYPVVGEVLAVLARHLDGVRVIRPARERVMVERRGPHAVVRIHGHLVSGVN
jgi:hypothetical protein